MRDLRQELEALVRQVPPAVVESGCTVTRTAFAEEAFLVTLAWRSAELGVWFRPVDHPTDCCRQTARFKIGFQGSPADAPTGLVDAWARRLEEWEASLPDGAVERLFGVPMSGTPGGDERAAPLFEPSVEWISVTLGIKPACRLVVAESEVETIQAAARAASLHCEDIRAASFISRFSTATNAGKATLLYVARTVESAVAARDAERAMIDSDRSFWRRRAPHIRKLGAALGYPTCCVEAFMPVRHQPNATIRFRALAQTDDPISFLLNDFVEDRRSLVSHFVCRYDCAASLRNARAVFDQLPQSRAGDLRRSARGFVVAFREGGVLRLIPLDDSADNRFSSVESSGDGQRLRQWRSALERADTFEHRGDSVRVKHGHQEIACLPAPRSEVQLRGFF